MSIYSIAHSPRMITPALPDHILRQGRALVRAIEALDTIEPTGPFERIGLPADGCLQAPPAATVKVVPTWVSEEMLSTSERGKAAPPLDFRPELPYTMCV